MDQIPKELVALVGPAAAFLIWGFLYGPKKDQGDPLHKLESDINKEIAELRKELANTRERLAALEATVAAMGSRR
jgi:septal ring factor EnvC (AmiA/AmiB activator)